MPIADLMVVAIDHQDATQGLTHRGRLSLDHFPPILIYPNPACSAHIAMPGPGNKRHKAKKSRTNVTVRDLSDVNVPGILDAYNVEEVNSAAGWRNIVLLLCRMFDLPSEYGNTITQ